MMGIRIRIYGVGIDAARHLSLLSSPDGNIPEPETRMSRKTDHGKTLLVHEPTVLET